MKTFLTIAILVIGLPLAGAEDIKSLTGLEYKGATISRVEPDGIVLIYSAGIVKIPFTELPPELRKKYGYNPEAAQSYAAQVQRAADARYVQVQADRQAEATRINGELQHKIKPTVPQTDYPVGTRVLDGGSSAKTISLSRLFADYTENAINADELYKGQTYNIGGKIKAISTDDHGPVVDLDVPCGGGACWAEAYFTNSAGLTTFRPGNNLSFVGTVEGVRGHTLIIKNCRLPQ